MTAPEVRAVVTLHGRRADAVSIEDVCDGDRAARARHQWAGGALRAGVRVTLVPVANS
ncbi:hypothetical protein [Dietzia sp. 179-F 9C3 NHS]|uniref:hypothetical protein n=1 Tax=Dietzia sp. 179-F 9C3 NHS TaxID=3374295 RepID=UPI00387945D6